MRNEPTSRKPAVFIGSSVEGLRIAEYIQLELEYHAECTIWHQGVFGLSGGTLESLLTAANSFQFAILVLTPDDLVQKRSATVNSPRDNVLFELGIFMGALGRERTFIVYCRDNPPDLPTDLAGVTAATYAKREDGNLHAAIGPVCTRIKSAIEASSQMQLHVQPLKAHSIVQTYEFEHPPTPRYHPALIIGEETRAPMKLKIQFLSAEPDTTRRLRVDRELRTISEQLRNGDRRELFETAEPQLAVRVTDIQAHIRRARAQIVHFSGYGEEGGYLLIENAAGNPQRLSPESLRMLFELWNDDRHLRCAVFNASHTHTLADALVQAPAALDCAIGTRDNIPDTPAIQFSLGFYSALADGATLEKAFKAGQVQIGLQYPQYVNLFHLAVAEPAILHKPLFQR